MRSLTGVKPTHIPHLGNFLGAISPAIEMSKTMESFYFIADYHALTILRDPAKMRQYTYDVAASWIAAGLDIEKSHFYRQSDVPEVFELAWTLACVLATGQLERGHAYKDALAKGEAPNAGVFYYPVLMAADIILFDANVVPVGQDQLQHVELARDVAMRVNHVFGEGTLVVPQAKITDAPVVPGTDGTKMSKSKGNTLVLFEDAKAIRKACMRIETGSEPLEAPKDPESSSVYQIYRFVATEAEQAAMADKLRAGGYGWGHAKDDLAAAIERTAAPIRETFRDLRPNEKKLDEMLQHGADKVRPIARETLRRVREAVGVSAR